MNKFLKLHWVSIILIFLSAVLISILIRKTKELKSEIAFKQDKINELENEVERVKKLNVELEITSRFNSNLEKSNNSHQERFKAENISDVGATVVYRKSGCSYFILESSQGYIVAEWFGGRDPDIGEVLLGQFNSFGLKDLVTTNNSNCHLWIDDYMLSKERALEKINDHCD